MAKSTEPVATEEPVNVGLETEQQWNPTREAVQKAALKDHQRRMNPGQYVPLPNSEFVRVQQAMPGHWYPGEKTDRMMGNPELILIDAKPGWHERMPRYYWAIREDTVKHGGTPRHALTQHLKRAGRIRYIEESEVNPGSPYAVYEVLQMGETKYVISGSMILCEILDPKLSYQMYKGWDDQALQKQMQVPQSVENATNFDLDIAGTRSGSVPGFTETKVTEFAANPRTMGGGG